MSPLLRWLPLVAASLLAGCASVSSTNPPQASSVAEINQQQLASLASIHEFSMQGRIGVQTEGKGFSGSSHWQHDGQNDNIALFSPLGGQVATIIASNDGVQLVTSDGKIFRAADVETLTQQNLGWSLPMRGLPDWILGRPTASPVQLQQWDEAGRLTRLQQDGWDIEYAQYADTGGYQLPGKVTLLSLKLNLKLIIEHWQINPTKNAD